MAKASIFGRNPVCGVVAARKAEDALRQLRRGLQYTDTIEVRLDWLSNAVETARFARLLKRSKIPRRATLIATCRRRQAGGKFSGALNEQLRALRSATNAGCQWIDLEVESVEALQRFVLVLYTAHVKRILSLHDFRSTPSKLQLDRRMRRLCEIADNAGFDAIKIATKCNSLAESLRVLSLPQRFRNREIIAVPMGDVATPARILAPRFGSTLSYASIEEVTAPGQISLTDMNQLYRSAHLTARTRVYGVIGEPVAHSLSPVLHNAGFGSRKIDAIYLPFRVADLRDFVRSIGPLGIAGFSVTLPHKERILRDLDGCDPLAAEIGAVNTVVVRGQEKLFGYNTDYVGVLRAIERRMPIAGSRVLILGAGGAARAVGFALAKGGASVSICARREAPARQLAREVGGDTIARASLRREFFDAIVNATPVGMHPNTRQSPLSTRELNCRIVFDTIYRPRRTKLLQLAASKGIETISGLDMFLAQGVAQWEIWTGMRAPEAQMRRAVLQELGKEEREREES